MKNGFDNFDNLFLSYIMADVQKTLEIIFMEAAKVFGKDESQTLLNKVFETTTKVIETKVVEKKKKSKKEESTKVVETKVEESTKVIETKEEKSTKRIGRMTQTIANKLKAELVKGGFKFSDNEEKELTNFKKKFVSYVDELTNNDFTAKGLEKHMEDFASTYKPASATTAVSTEAEAPTTSILAGPSNVATIADLTLEELQAIENIMTPNGGKKGVYWNCDEGKWVTGPDQEDDEEITEKKFNGKTYGIGDKTGRVYEITDDKDIFVGFIGVGAFAKMKA